MERLTKHHINKTMGAYMVCSGACIDDDFNCTGCEKFNEIVDRLAAYEDTGLEPEGVAERIRTCKELVQIFERSDSYNGIGPIEHICELSRAEKDGRLVMLPDAKYTDADGEKALQEAMWVCGNTNNPVTRYTADAIAEKLCREARDENPPLTLEELREMYGEPVWVYNAYNGWCTCRVIDEINAISIYFTDGMARYLNMYGNGWTAYRRKPEEEAANG